MYHIDYITEEMQDPLAASRAIFIRIFHESGWKSYPPAPYTIGR